jgi:hypothetical protein
VWNITSCAESYELFVVRSVIFVTTYCGPENPSQRPRSQVCTTALLRAPSTARDEAAETIHKLFEIRRVESISPPIPGLAERSALVFGQAFSEPRRRRKVTLRLRPGFCDSSHKKAARLHFRNTKKLDSLSRGKVLWEELSKSGLLIWVALPRHPRLICVSLVTSGRRSGPAHYAPKYPCGPEVFST